jgi:hypothetical protein
MGSAVAAGGSVVKEAAAVQWGGYSGYFSDPDGHLWKGPRLVCIISQSGHVPRRADAGSPAGSR